MLIDFKRILFIYEVNIMPPKATFSSSSLKGSLMIGEHILLVYSDTSEIKREFVYVYPRPAVAPETSSEVSEVNVEGLKRVDLSQKEINLMLHDRKSTDSKLDNYIKLMNPQRSFISPFELSRIMKRRELRETFFDYLKEYNLTIRECVCRAINQTNYNQSSMSINGLSVHQLLDGDGDVFNYGLTVFCSPEDRYQIALTTLVVTNKYLQQLKDNPNVTNARTAKRKIETCISIIKLLGDQKILHDIPSQSSSNFNNELNSCFSLLVEYLNNEKGDALDSRAIKDKCENVLIFFKSILTIFSDTHHQSYEFENKLDRVLIPILEKAIESINTSRKNPIIFKPSPFRLISSSPLLDISGDRAMAMREQYKEFKVTTVVTYPTPIIKTKPTPTASNPEPSSPTSSIPTRESEFQRIFRVEQERIAKENGWDRLDSRTLMEAQRVADDQLNQRPDTSISTASSSSSPRPTMP